MFGVNLYAKREFNIKKKIHWHNLCPTMELTDSYSILTILFIYFLKRNEFLMEIWFEENFQGSAEFLVGVISW